MVDQPLAFYDLKVGDGGGGADRVTCVGVAVGKLAVLTNALVDLVGQTDPAHGQVAAGQALGHGDHIGAQVQPL